VAGFCMSCGLLEGLGLCKVGEGWDTLCVWVLLLFPFCCCGSWGCLAFGLVGRVVSVLGCLSDMCAELCLVLSLGCLMSAEDVCCGGKVCMHSVIWVEWVGYVIFAITVNVWEGGSVG